jgi:hypothetical protein
MVEKEKQQRTRRRKPMKSSGEHYIVHNRRHSRQLALRPPQPRRALGLLDRVRRLFELLAPPFVDLAAPVGGEGGVGLVVSM